MRRKPERRPTMHLDDSARTAEAAWRKAQTVAVCVVLSLTAIRALTTSAKQRRTRT